MGLAAAADVLDQGSHLTALTIHPEDGAKFDLPDSATVRLETESGATSIDLAYDERMQPGTAALNNGQGMTFRDEDGNALPFGVFANEFDQPSIPGPGPVCRHALPQVCSREDYTPAICILLQDTH